MTATHKARHIPMRRCVVCRSSKPQAELLRLYQTSEGMWQFDLKKRAGGRGTWLCRETSCHDLKKLKRFFRADAERIASELSLLQSVLPKPSHKEDECPTR